MQCLSKFWAKDVRVKKVKIIHTYQYNRNRESTSSGLYKHFAVGAPLPFYLEMFGTSHGPS